MRSCRYLIVMRALATSIYIASSPGVLACVTDSNWPSLSAPDVVRARFIAFAEDRNPRCVLIQERVIRGTLDGLFRTYPQLEKIRQVPGGVIYTSPKAPKEVYVVVQVRSIQGNDILLGPANLPGVESPSRDALSNWVVSAVQTPFDENRHYAAYYINNADKGTYMFALYERRAGKEPLPVESIFRHRSPANPKFLTESENAIEGEKRRAANARESNRFLRIYDAIKGFLGL